MADLRVTVEALELQARVAEACERRLFAENSHGAVELVDMPQEKLMEISRAFRSGRLTKAGLRQLADELETRWHAVTCANLVPVSANACQCKS